MLYENKLNPGDSVADLSRNYIVSQKFVKGYVDHLAQIETRKEKWKAANAAVGNKITTTLNESNCIILTKYRRWKFMNLICIWYVMESCQGEEARESRIYKVHIASRILSGMEKDTPLREETSAG